MLEAFYAFSYKAREPSLIQGGIHMDFELYGGRFTSPRIYLDAVERWLPSWITYY